MPFEVKVNILLVDDRQDGLITLEAVLDQPNYNLVKARSGREALGALLENDFAVIILDVQMPGMDGFEVARLIKQRERSRDIPIIFVTAINKDPSFVYQGYDTGAVDYLFKPFDPRILRSKVSVFVELYHKNRQLREQAELLARSEERIRQLIDIARDVIATLSVDGTIHSLNPAFETLTERPPSEGIGKTLAALCHPDDAERLADEFDRAVSGQTPLFNARLATKSGEFVFIEGSAKAIVQDGKVTGVITILRDVSERIRAENERRQRDELERSNRELEQFASICSHDLQEPLRIISNFTQLLSRNYKGKLDPEADEMIGHIVKGTRRMSHLIKDVLSYSRLSAPGDLPEPIPLRSALNEALTNLRATIAETNAEITAESLPDLPVHYSQMIQLFQNLIANAIKFRRDQPQIRVEAKKEKGLWRISVSDNGIGIEAEYRDRIFDIFKRLHGRDEYPGTGMGLAICKKIVERHGGRIWVESVPGEGATFLFTLPATIRISTEKKKEAVKVTPRPTIPPPPQPPPQHVLPRDW